MRSVVAPPANKLRHDHGRRSFAAIAMAARDLSMLFDGHYFEALFCATPLQPYVEG